MWFNHRNNKPDWAPAIRHLRKVDPAFIPVIKRVGPCLLAPRRDCFVTLCQSIFSQQLSTAVAAALFARFRDLFPRRRPTPQRLLELSDEQLQSAGLSRQKRDYLRDLAAHFADGRVPVRRFAKMDDERIVQSLLPIHGVGRWTCEMFLIFVLNRPDVLPVDDFGLRRGVQVFRGLREIPKPAQVTQIGQLWRPYRTVATWYLWRNLTAGGIPRSDD